MNLKQSFILGLILAIIGIAGWEMYWRSQDHIPNLDDNDDTWAIQRAKLERPSKDQVVFIGSSRILFDIQHPIWRAKTGTEPVQLASQGSSPLPILKDVVENTDFNGLMVVGVTPGLFFGTANPMARPMKWPQERVDYYYDRTYAQRLNHWLSIPLQQNFAFVTAATDTWDTDVDLKTLIVNARTGERAGPLPVPFYQFEELSLDRNMQMNARTTNDTVYANFIKRAWQDMLKGDRPPPDKDGTISYFLEYAKKFQERGGSIILVRCPSDGFFKQGEAMGLPRVQFWDSLVVRSKLPAYHYDDYPQFRNLNLPEWSHLSKEDADFFTEELIEIMQKDGVLTKNMSE